MPPHFSRWREDAVPCRYAPDAVRPSIHTGPASGTSGGAVCGEDFVQPGAGPATKHLQGAITTSGEPSAVAAQVYLELVFGEKVPLPYDPLPISGLRAAAPDPDAPADWARLYPNPATKHLQVQLAGDYLPAELVIRDINGQTVSEVSLSSPSTKVDLSQLPSGLFHVEILAKPDRVYQQKVVILK